MDTGHIPVSLLMQQATSTGRPPKAMRPGTVFQLKRTNGNWILKTLGLIGSSPFGKVVRGPGGALYGTTNQGGSGGCQFGCGTVYELRPACVTGNCSWIVSVLHSFRDWAASDGYSPGDVDPVFDQAGNLYGTTQVGGSGGYGVVFKLTPSGDGWTESLIHNFNFGGDEAYGPISGVIFDNGGNLYGTTGSGGVYGQGTVYRLTPSGAGWVASTLYSFLGGEDGGDPNWRADL